MVYERSEIDPTYLLEPKRILLTAGREIWGYQKKLAEIGLYHEQEAVRGQVNRLGHQILKALVVPEYIAKMDEIPGARAGYFH